MDASEALSPIGSVIEVLDQPLPSTTHFQYTIDTIKIQAGALKAEVERLRQLQTGIQHTNRSPVINSTYDAVETVNYTANALQTYLRELYASGSRSTGITAGRGSSTTGLVSSDSPVNGLKEYLTNLRQCAALVEFAHSACQPQTTSEDRRHAEELRTAALSLRRAQESTQAGQRTQIATSLTHTVTNPSTEFQRFLDAMAAIERERESDTTNDANDDGNTGPDIRFERNSYLGMGVAPLNFNERAVGKMAINTQGHIGRANQIASEDHLSNKPLGRQDSTMAPIPVSSEPQHISVSPVSSFDSHQRSPVARTVSSQPSVSDQSDSPTIARGAPSVINGLYTVGETRQSLPARPSAKSSYAALSRKPVGSASSSRPSLQPQDSSVSEKSFLSRSSEASTSFHPLPPKPTNLQSPVDTIHDEAPPAYDSPVVPLSPIETPVQRRNTDINGVDEAGCPYIVKAVQDNMAAVVQVLIERGADVEAKEAKSGRTAIMEAARLGRADIVNLLLNRGCRLDRVDSAGNTAVHLAVEGGNQAILKTFLESGLTTVNARGSHNRTPLHTAAAVLDADMAMLLLHNRADPSLKDDSQRTPLHLSATRGHSRLCEILLEKGATLDTFDNESKTPLQLAAQNDQSEVVEALLRRTSTLKTNESSLLQAFYEAVKVGNVRMAQSFIGRGIKVKKIKESWKPVAYAAQSGNIEMINLMIDNKASLKDRSPDGWTALHFAARHGHRGMTERLLEKKLSWKAQTRKREETALHLAISARHEGVAEFLIAHKSAEVGVKDADDQQPLHHAARIGSARMVDQLILAGAKVNEQNKYGWKPIHVATAYGHAAVAASLISRGASIEDRLDSTSFKPAKRTHEAIRRGYTCEARWPHQGSRPLHLAIEFGRADMVSRLLGHGAKADERDAKGWRPLHHAAFTANAELVHALLQKGANPHATTSDGNTPLAVGFRAIALDATDQAREATRDYLRTAMLHRQKSRLTGLIDSFAIGASSTVAARTQAWSAAEMAQSLLATGGPRVEEGEIDDDDDSDDGPDAAPAAPLGDPGLTAAAYAPAPHAAQSHHRLPSRGARSPSGPLELSGISAQPPELDGQMHLELDAGTKN